VRGRRVERDVAVAARGLGAERGEGCVSLGLAVAVVSIRPVCVTSSASTSTVLALTLTLALARAVPRERHGNIDTNTSTHAHITRRLKSLPNRSKSRRADASGERVLHQIDGDVLREHAGEGTAGELSVAINTLLGKDLKE
jgi:hypothetical protein